MKGNRLWLLGTVAVMAAVVLLGWFLGIAPRLAEADATGIELASVEQLNLVQEAEIAALQAQQSDTEALQEELATLRDAIPSSVRADAFVDSVTAAAAQAGVAIKSIRFEDPGPWGVAPESEGAPSPTAEESTTPPPFPTADPGVFTVAVSIEVIGDPLATIAFARLLQEGERLFLATTFGFTTDPDKVATLSGYVFLFVDPNGPAEELEGSPTAPDVDPEPSPTPTPSATPAPSGTPTPTP